MKNSRLLLLVLLIGCNLPPERPPVYFFGDDTAVCAGARAVTFSTDLTFEVDVLLLSGFSRDYALDYLDAKDVVFKGPGQYVVESIDKVTMPLRLPGPVAVLVDQHGTWADIDSSNFRSKQLNQFVHELPASGSFLLGGFASGGLMTQAPVEYATPSFEADADVTMPFLFGLSKRTGGISVLYDATTSAVNQFTTGPNRNLVLLVHGRDSVSTGDINSVVTAAVTQSVRLDIIFIGSPADALTLCPLSLRTGGLFVSCPNDKYMITATNQLNNIYNGEPIVMRVKVKFTPPAPLSSGDETFHQMVIHNTLDNVDYNTVPVYIKVP